MKVYLAIIRPILDRVYLGGRTPYGKGGCWMPKIIGVATLKGGTGKTTSSVAIAERLTNEGISCALVDADEQASLTTWATMATDKPAPIQTPVKALEADTKPAQLSRKVKEFASECGADFVVIDNGPGDIHRIDATIELAAELGGVIIIPSSSSYLDLPQAIAMVEEVDNRVPSSVLLTLTRAITTEEKTARKELASLEVPVMMASVPLAVGIKRAVKGERGPYEQLLAIYEPAVIELLGNI